MENDLTENPLPNPDELNGMEAPVLTLFTDDEDDYGSQLLQLHSGGNDDALSNNNQNESYGYNNNQAAPQPFSQDFNVDNQYRNNHNRNTKNDKEEVSDEDTAMPDANGAIQQPKIIGHPAPTPPPPKVQAKATSGNSNNNHNHNQNLNYGNSNNNNSNNRQNRILNQNQIHHSQQQAVMSNVSSLQQAQSNPNTVNAQRMRHQQHHINNNNNNYQVPFGNAYSPQTTLNAHQSTVPAAPNNNNNDNKPYQRFVQVSFHDLNQLYRGSSKGGSSNAPKQFNQQNHTGNPAIKGHHGHQQYQNSNHHLASSNSAIQQQQFPQLHNTSTSPAITPPPLKETMTYTTTSSHNTGPDDLMHHLQNQHQDNNHNNQYYGDQQYSSQSNANISNNSKYQPYDINNNTNSSPNIVNPHQHHNQQLPRTMHSRNMHHGSQQSVLYQMNNNNNSNNYNNNSLNNVNNHGYQHQQYINNNTNSSPNNFNTNQHHHQQLILPSNNQKRNTKYRETMRKFIGYRHSTDGKGYIVWISRKNEYRKYKDDEKAPAKDKIRWGTTGGNYAENRGPPPKAQIHAVKGFLCGYSHKPSDPSKTKQIDYEEASDYLIKIRKDGTFFREYTANSNIVNFRWENAIEIQDF